MWNYFVGLIFSDAKLELYGISGLENHGDGNLYLWGNVVMYCDIRSFLCFIMANVTNGVVVQFLVSGGDLLFLTDSGQLLHVDIGGSSIAQRAIAWPQSVMDMINEPPHKIVGIFADTNGVRYVLVKTSEGVKREQIKDLHPHSSMLFFMIFLIVFPVTLHLTLFITCRCYDVIRIIAVSYLKTLPFVANFCKCSFVHKCTQGNNICYVQTKASGSG